jgi:DNA-binding beta-propeller fold protein YncE
MRLLLSFLLVLAAALPAGGAGAQIRPAAIGAPASRPLVWPNSTEEPARVAFRSTLSSERDIGRKQSTFARFRSMVEGTTEGLTLVKRPYDIVVSPDRRVFISDGARSQVMVFDPRTRAATTLGDTGPGRGRLVKPMGLGVDPRGDIYVADQGAKRVVAFAPDGTARRTYGGPSVFLNPVDVEVDATAGIVYVADSYLHQVLVFRQSDGALLRRLGRNEGDIARKQKALGMLSTSHDLAAADLATRSSLGHSPNRSNEPRDLVENRGAGPGEFRYPAFLALGPDGHLYVSDALNFRVQMFDRGGRFVRSIGKQGDGPGTFARPKGIAVDSEGHLYVADAAFNNVQIFDAQGQLLLPFAQMGRGEGELVLPLGLHIDAHDYLYIADRGNDRVQVFEYLRADRALARPAARR